MTVTVFVAVTGGSVTAAVFMLVAVLRGIEIKELQSFVADAATIGFFNALRTSETD